MKDTQANAETAKQQMYLNVLESVRMELSPGCTAAEMLRPMYRLLIAAMGSSGFESMFDNEVEREGLSMCLGQIDMVFTLLEPVVPGEEEDDDED